MNLIDGLHSSIFVIRKNVFTVCSCLFCSHGQNIIIIYINVLIKQDLYVQQYAVVQMN